MVHDYGRIIRLLALVLAAAVVVVVAACSDDAGPPDPAAVRADTETAGRDFGTYKAALEANGYGDHFQSDLEAEEFLNRFCDTYEELGIELMVQPETDDLDRLTAPYCNSGVQGGPPQEDPGGDPIP